MSGRIDPKMCGSHIQKGNARCIKSSWQHPVFLNGCIDPTSGSSIL